MAGNLSADEPRQGIPGQHSFTRAFSIGLWLGYENSWGAEMS